ncbi:MAG TPA: phosphate ABC transporter permease PstA [Candidatus Coatesbacteria bacterium]|nr:phosphate ABC transporter permease PstA [Candidatus Coatesbacteria bacterium]
MKARRFRQLFWFGLSGLAVLVVVGMLVLVVGDIIAKGAGVVSWEFLTEMPRRSMTEGGIWPAILGTLLLSVGAIVFALPLGLFAAIYLVEYSREGRLRRWIRIGVNSLSGVPSVVFGLFGLALFVNYFGLGASLLAGGLTLGLMVLPLIIRATEEALKAVPVSFREASLALGATRWHTTVRVVLPAALSQILTGVILAVGRAAGETAPILFTAAVFFTKRLPTGLSSKVMALPYHIYALLTEGTHPVEQTAMAYGTALVLLMLVLVVNGTAIFFRIRARKGKKW